MDKQHNNQAFCLLPSDDLNADVAFFRDSLGFQLSSLYPSDLPTIANLSGYGLNLRLDTAFKGSASTLLISTTDADKSPSQSPGGVEIRWELCRENHVQRIESYQAEICTLRSTPWVKGKAGMHTRDLIPSRLGGAVTATHIRIPNGGPVADRVHYHAASFQLVFCVQGWIKLVYEDQGESVTLHPGDCVTQPPNIRHKVLETSNGLEVIEFGMPEEFVTSIDNDLSLPNGRVDSHRLYDGQRFCHYQHTKAAWQPHRLPGIAASNTGVTTASAGIAGAQVLRSNSALPAYFATHDAQVLFSYVLAGSIRIDGQLMVAGDAFTLPPAERVKVGDVSTDVQVLEISVPGVFRTVV